MEKSIDTKKLTQVLDGILKSLGYDLIKDNDQSFLRENLHIKMVESTINNAMVYEYTLNNEFILKWFIAKDGEFHYYTPYYKEPDPGSLIESKIDTPLRKSSDEAKETVLALVAEGLDNLRNKLNIQLTEINSTLKLMEKKK